MRCHRKAKDPRDLLEQSSISMATKTRVGRGDGQGSKEGMQTCPGVVRAGLGSPEFLLRLRKQTANPTPG